VEDQDEWNEVFSQICAKLITYNFTWLGDRIDNVGYDFLAPLANAKNLTTLKLRGIPSSETFRQMADNYTCLKNLEFYCDVNVEENSDVAYFLEKQSQTLTSIIISTPTENPLPAISKCRNLKTLSLTSYVVVKNLDSLGSLSKLKYLWLNGITNSDMGNSIKAAKFQHLTEIVFSGTDNLSDYDVSQIAKTYGQQV
jgi:Leucine-rich repeat (LRR) protein